MLNVQELTVRYGDLTIVDGVSFDVAPGDWLMLVGPNGAGKSTIVDAVSQGTAYSGRVLINGADAGKLKPGLRAREIGVLTQSHYVGYSFTVEEVVRLGRYAYAPGIFSDGTGDDAAVAAALEQTGLTGIRHQSVLTLSGGELQRTFLAQLFAQDPKLLVLDEPSNHLDLVYQKQVMELIRDWLKTPGRSVISVVHDLSLAFAYGTRALLLDHGRVVNQGAVGEVLSPDNLQSVYSMDVYAWMRSMLSQWN